MVDARKALIVDYDAEHDVLRILNGESGSYTGQISDDLVVDLAANGAPVAIELLDAAKWLAPALAQMVASGKAGNKTRGNPAIQSIAE